MYIGRDLFSLLGNLVEEALAGDGGDQVVEYQQFHLEISEGFKVV